MKIKLFGKAFSTFVACGVAAALFAVPAWSQDEDEDAAELGTIEVTGSRLKQTDIETASPVTIYQESKLHCQVSQRLRKCCKRHHTTHLDPLGKPLGMPMDKQLLITFHCVA